MRKVISELTKNFNLSWLASLAGVMRGILLKPNLVKKIKKEVDFIKVFKDFY